MISLCLSVLMIGMRTEARTRSIWPYFGSYYFKRVLMVRRGVEFSCRLCDGEGLYLGVEAIDFCK